MTGSAGLAAAAERMRKERGELERIFPSFFRGCFLRDAEECINRKLPVCADAAVVELSAGGVFTGLWKLGELLHTGLSVEIRRIPIRQETIEICEYYDLDPYYADTSGGFLIAPASAPDLIRRFREQNIPLSVIGFLEPGRARKIIYPEHVRCLDKPRAFLG